MSRCILVMAPKIRPAAITARGSGSGGFLQADAGDGLRDDGRSRQLRLVHLDHCYGRIWAIALFDRPSICRSRRLRWSWAGSWNMLGTMRSDSSALNLSSRRRTSSDIREARPTRRTTGPMSGGGLPSKFDPIGLVCASMWTTSVLKCAAGLPRGTVHRPRGPSFSQCGVIDYSDYARRLTVSTAAGPIDGGCAWPGRLVRADDGSGRGRGRPACMVNPPTSVRI